VRQACAIDPPIDHRDVTTIIALLGDIKGDVRKIRTLLEDDDGEEEELPEADA
jgi:phage host-nuclease inhibitor protein Gam